MFPGNAAKIRRGSFHPNIVYTSIFLHPKLRLPTPLGSPVYVRQRGCVCCCHLWSYFFCSSGSARRGCRGKVQMLAATSGPRYFVLRQNEGVPRGAPRTGWWISPRSGAAVTLVVPSTRATVLSTQRTGSFARHTREKG